MSVLSEMAKGFSTSEPVFRVEIYNDGKDIRFPVDVIYTPDITLDPVMELLVDNYSEYLDVAGKTFRPSVDVDRAMYLMMTVIRQFTVSVSTLKNPKQTKMYKWLMTDCAATSPLSNGFIALYRYIKNNNIEYTNDATNVHVKNVLAILELMRQKYENQASSN